MQKQARFSALDGLRGFAAIGVFLYHGADIVGFPVASGYLAVDFFFCLSGFVIAAAYEQKLAAGEPVSRFLIARLTRLYPVYLLGMLAGLVFVCFRIWRDGTGVQPSGFLASLALGLVFLPSPPELVGSFSTRTFPFVIQAWSLFYELAANLLYAGIARFVTTPRLLLVLLVILPFLMSAAFSFGTLDLGPEWVTLAAGFARAFFSFFFGVLLVRLRPRATVLPGWVAWACVAALLAALTVRPDPILHESAYGLGLVAFVFPALTLTASMVSAGPRSQGVFSFLGAASYPLYILHGTILFAIRAALAAFQIKATDIPQALWLLLFAIVVVVSAFIDRSYEQPAIRWLRARFRR